MNVLVTGCAGYIGGQTALQLKDAGHNVYGIDRNALPDHLAKLHLFEKFIQADFVSDLALQCVVRNNIDAIIHCAGTSLVGPSMTKPCEYYSNNFVKTQQLCDHILAMPAGQQPRIIFSSSAAVYGNPIISPCNEVDPVEPISPYGESKLMVEWLLRSYATAYGLDYVAFRYFNACGADPVGRHGQAPGATHIIARILENTLAGLPFVCNGNDYNTDDGTCIRDYVHVADIVAAHIAALDKTKVPSDVYNLGSSTGSSNLDVTNAARGVMHLPITVKFGERRAGDPDLLTADSSKFSKITKWTPKYSLHDIVQHAWNWYNV